MCGRPRGQRCWFLPRCLVAPELSAPRGRSLIVNVSRSLTQHHKRNAGHKKVKGLHGPDSFWILECRKPALYLDFLAFLGFGLPPPARR